MNNLYNRPRSEKWFGAADVEPPFAEGIRRPNLYGRDENERWFGELDDVELTYVLRFQFSQLTLGPSTIYVSEDGAAVCYYNNVTSGELTFTGIIPPDCGGIARTNSIDGDINLRLITEFKLWWNEAANCGSPAEADGTSLSLENLGTGNMLINGATPLPAGGTYTLSPTGFAYAGFANGDQSAYASGTSLIVSRTA